MTFLLSLANSLDGPHPGRGGRAFAVQRLADRASVSPAGTRLEIVDVGGVLVLSGEIDLSTRDLVTEAVRRLRCADPGQPHGARVAHRYLQDVVLHVGGVSFVDATGLGTLVALSTEVASDGRRFRLVGASRELHRLSELCELDTVLGLDPV